MYAYITFEVDYDSFQAAHGGETKEISREKRHRHKEC